MRERMCRSEGATLRARLKPESPRGASPDQEDILEPTDLDVQRESGGAPQASPEARETLELGTFTTDAGKGIYQIASRWREPWTQPSPSMAAPSPLGLEVQVAPARLHLGKIFAYTVSLRSRRAIPMPLLELGLPPGVEVDTEALERLVDAGQIGRFSVGLRSLTIYLEVLNPEIPIRLEVPMRVRAPMRGKAGLSRVCAYYQPELQATVGPVEVEAR